MPSDISDRDAWSTSSCSIARTLDVVRTRSAFLLLREAFLGTSRFDDFARRVGVTEPVAAARLKELVADGLLEREPYQEAGQRTRFAYVLTPKGRALLPVITALREWGDAWASGPSGPSVVAEHRDCGSPVRAVLRCDAGHDVGGDEIVVRPAPGRSRKRGR